MYHVEFFGKAVHASHPSMGINALEDAASFITRIKELQVPGKGKMEEGTYTVLDMDGGDPSFTVPSYCQLLVTRHLTLGEEEKNATHELKEIVRDLSLKSKVKVTKRPVPSKKVEYRPYLSEKNEYTERFMSLLMHGRKSLCRFVTSSVGDFNLFATRTKVPTLVFGPGGGNIHAANEYVNKNEVIRTAGYLVDFFREVF
jgi:succinyl-diaminopimelate desuccinylase